MDNREPSRVAINGTAVRQRRKEDLRISQRPFAARCGISEGYLSHIEVGRRKTVSPEVFARICDALGVKVKDRWELIVDREAAA